MNPLFLTDEYTTHIKSFLHCFIIIIYFTFQTAKYKKKIKKIVEDNFQKHASPVMQIRFLSMVILFEGMLCMHSFCWNA